LHTKSGPRPGMTLTPVERGSSNFAAFESALAAAGLPITDLDADDARYFAFGLRADEQLAYIGVIRFGDEALLRSLVVPEELRGQSYGNWAIDAIALQARKQGVLRIWLLTTDAEGYFVRQGFRIVHRKDVPSAIVASRQFSSTCPDTAVLMCLTLV
jgi:N-acetylglutamate synthase-like GNAT family acetyltransferase